jgi:hypothetical protein
MSESVFGVTWEEHHEQFVEGKKVEDITFAV